MATAPSRPALRERYDRRRQETVHRAAKVFAKQGYDQTTMQELASTMGLATGALYHYFGAKEQLLRAICDQLMEPLLDRARALVAEPAPAPEQLRALVRLWVAHVIEHRDHMLVFQQERHVIESGPEWRGVRASRKAFERLVAEVMAAAVGGSGSRDLRGPPETPLPARHGQPHRPVVPPAGRAQSRADRGRLRRPRSRGRLRAPLTRVRDP